MKISAMAEKYELVELFGKAALFTNNRLDRTTVPDGVYAYDLRHGDSGDPVTVEPHVGVNHAATVILKEPLDFGNDDYISIGDGLNFLGEDSTLAQYASRYDNIAAPDASAIDTAFRARVQENYENYVRKWLGMEPTYLIEQAEEIAATKHAYTDLLNFAPIDDKEYLLKFKNPLEVMRDIFVDGIGFHSQYDELSDLLGNELDREAALQKYALEEVNDGQMQGGGMEML